MEIGGFDRTFKPRNRVTPQHIDLLLRHVQAKWPNAVFEVEVQPNEERIQPLQALIIKGCKLPETIYIYENGAAVVSWDKHGATPENDEQLMLVMADEDDIAFTVGSPDGPAGKMIEEVITAWTNQPDKF